MKKKAKKANQRKTLKRKTAHLKENNVLGRKTAHLNVESKWETSSYNFIYKNLKSGNRPEFFGGNFTEFFEKLKLIILTILNNSKNSKIINLN